MKVVEHPITMHLIGYAMGTYLAFLWVIRPGLKKISVSTFRVDGSIFVHKDILRPGSPAVISIDAGKTIEQCRGCKRFFVVLDPGEKERWQWFWFCHFCQGKPGYRTGRNPYRHTS